MHCYVCNYRLSVSSLIRHSDELFLFVKIVGMGLVGIFPYMCSISWIQIKAVQGLQGESVC